MENHFSEKSHSEQKNHFVIRNAIPSDSVGIIDCMQSVMSEKVYLVSEIYLYSERGQKDLIRNPDDLNLVAIIGNEIVGTINVQRGIYKKNRHTANLGIAIKKQYREMGIGTELIKRAIKWAFEQNILKMNLEVFSSNEKAVSLYKKLGFEIEGVRRGQFVIENSFVDDVLMTIYPTEIDNKNDVK